MRAGAVVFVGVAIANLGNGLYHLIAGRALGPTRYGELASLLAVIGLVAYPLAALQLTVGRDVSRFRSQGRPDSIKDLYRRMSIGGLFFGVVFSFVLAGTMLLARGRLELGSTSAILLTAAGTLPATFAPIVAGMAQGLERFGLFSFAQFLGPFLRIVLLVPFLIVGVGVGGAMAATTLASVLTVLFVMFVLREWMARRPARNQSDGIIALLRPLGPALVGVLAFTSLTTIDVVVAKLGFTGRNAGVYGAASFLGRLILYLPSAIAAVVLPKVSSRSALGHASGDILVRSAGATAVLCFSCTVVFAVAPRQILDLAFGGKYGSGAPLMWMFGVAMAGFALLNLVFVYDLARHGWRAAILLACGSLVQLAAFAIWHRSGQELLMIDIGSAYALLGSTVLILHGRDGAARVRRMRSRTI